ALEDLSDVNADLAKGSGGARSIADEATGLREVRQRIDRRNGMMRRQRNELLASVAEERIGEGEERSGMQFDEGCESGADLAFAAGLQDTKRYPLRARRFPYVSHDALGTGIVR